MKSLFALFTLSILFASNSAMGQGIRVGQVYEQTGIADLHVAGSNSFLQSQKGTLYYIVEPTDSVIRIRVVPFDEPDSASQEKKLESAGIFDIDRNIFPLLFELYDVDASDIVSVGALILPVKLRLPHGDDIPFSFENNVSINAAIKLTPFSAWSSSWAARNISILIAPGLSSTTINAYNSDVIANAISDTSSGASPISSVREACFSVGTGIMFSFDQVTVSALVGWDYVSYNKQTYNWIYQGKTWFSIGVGVDLFNIAETKNEVSQ